MMWTFGQCMIWPILEAIPFPMSEKKGEVCYSLGVGGIIDAQPNPNQCQCREASTATLLPSKQAGDLF